MSHKSKPKPMQDRRGIGRLPVRDHAGIPSVGTRKPPVINDPLNGRDFDGGEGPAAGSGPGSNGPPTVGAFDGNASEW